MPMYGYINLGAEIIAYDAIDDIYDNVTKDDIVFLCIGRYLCFLATLKTYVTINVGLCYISEVRLSSSITY